MNSLTIYKDDYAGSTAISNRFIDNYMTEANDAQLKVYLYLVRMMSANLPTGISDMADKFNHTEKDIMRALKYWERQHLIALEYNEAKSLTGIRFLSPSEAAASVERPLAPIVPLKLVSAPAEVKAAEPAPTEPAKPDYDNISYSRDQLKAFKENAETGQLLFIAETYLQKQLTLKDIEILYFITDELKFSSDLVDYLLQYCVDRGKTSFAYIKKVAISWAEAEIKTPKQAKAFAGNSYDKTVYTILKSLGRNSTPTQKEAEIVTKWYKDYGFDLEIINEACGRSVLAVESHRLEYCEGILSSWKKAGVKNLSDIAAADASYRKPKAAASGAPSKNQFNQMIHTKYDFDEIERQILSN
ncbi:MAG: DnaD domain protein [Lachnospiraceae bacterium]|nr:DnaD domain protein [Lachnospiraceae bacterium]